MHKSMKQNFLSSANHIVSKPIQFADTFSRLHWIKNVKLLAEQIDARNNPMVSRYKREINLQMEHKKEIINTMHETWMYNQKCDWMVM
jgi:hypothetical protein